MVRGIGLDTATELSVRTVRRAPPFAGSYGACDQCGGECPEHFVATGRRIFLRADGQFYVNDEGGGAYGHLSCLIERFGDLIAEDSLVREGSNLLVPTWAVDKLRQTSTVSTTTSTPR